MTSPILEVHPVLLNGRNAIIYGGGGAIGGAIARAFATAGATVHLAGRTAATLEATAAAIRAAGGTAFAAEVDALDEAAVDAHADRVAATAGSIDISVNVIADNDVQGTPMVEMTAGDYLSPVLTNVRSKFLTTRAAARHMIRQGSGVLLFFGGAADRSPLRDYSFGGLLTAFEAVEQLRRQLATELAPHGIRVVTLRTGGVPEAIPASSPARAEVEAMLTAKSLTGRTATLQDVGRVAVFAASDWARTLTGTAINMSCGAMLD
ncbi:SDR family oxidoreductase [Dactylosporangium sp. AC04546]|uniref:SDR family NAD(P)-dependent oxidoreductase n=1 Tax=Dactylosporangium sp. AC04546 TaxID=2862460 RepID=UPI001EDEB7D7|nr:SDR family oxidoreductase [Dactylosporangium sp. AC04546]WVK86248.1 SDR family oxidoreductase [Dactylosporangium sp. AC04546]